MSVVTAPHSSRQSGLPPSGADALSAVGPLRVIKRSSSVSDWDRGKVGAAITKVFLAVEGVTAAGSSRVHDIVDGLTRSVADALIRRAGAARALHIEDIQDQVELALMRAEHQQVARTYVLYREARAEARRAAEVPATEPHVKRADGTTARLDVTRWRERMVAACAGLRDVSVERLLADARRNIYDGISESELALATIMAARALIDIEPNYTYVSARLLLDRLASEAVAFVLGPGVEALGNLAGAYPRYFSSFIARATELEILDPDLSSFDLIRLGQAIRPERDRQFQFLGLQTLYDHYLLRGGVRFELPQAFFVRVPRAVAHRHRGVPGPAQEHR